jgi:hypothetical protein
VSRAAFLLLDKPQTTQATPCRDPTDEIFSHEGSEETQRTEKDLKLSLPGTFVPLSVEFLIPDPREQLITLIW